MKTEFEKQQEEEEAARIAGEHERARNLARMRVIRYVTLAIVAVSASVAAPALATMIGQLPAVLAPIANGLVPIFWSAVNAAVMERDVAAAVLGGFLDRSSQLISAYSDPAVLSTLNVLPPGLTEAAQKTFSLDYAQRMADQVLAQPLQNLVTGARDPKTPLGEAILTARTFAAQKNVDPDAALAQVGVTPETLSARYPSLRQDVAAMAINAAFDRYVYAIEWFDPMTGRLKPARELREYRADLLKAQGASATEQIAALDRRSKRFPTSDGGEAPPPTVANLEAALATAVRRGASPAVLTALRVQLEEARVREQREREAIASGGFFSLSPGGTPGATNLVDVLLLAAPAATFVALARWRKKNRR